MSGTPLAKEAKPAWAKQLTRLPCLVVHVTFQNERRLMTILREDNGFCY